MRLEGKAAIITGAARGIGRGVAEAFVREGARVAVADVDEAAARATADEIGGPAGAAWAVAVDVAERGSVERMVAAVTERFGGVDVLVNNAGVSKVVAFLEMTDEVWDRTLAVNLFGAMLCARAVLPQMVERGAGRIINMSSQSGKKGNAQYAAYCASKFGLIGLTQSLAAEFASCGITVNAICPGVVMTGLWQSPEMRDAYAAKRGIKPEEVEAYFEGKIPLGRLGTPEDAAHVAVYLASDAAAYITGQAINVSGGAEMR